MIKNILLLIISVLLVMVGLEIGLRVSNWTLDPNPSNVNRYCHQYDELLGWRGKPDTHLIGYGKNIESLSVDLNSRGFRDKEYTFKKPPSIKRIVILGDSFAWGYNVKLEDSFPKVLEKALGEKFQVLSLSVLGYSTDQELILLKQEGLRYEPDIVILALFLNDVFDNGNIATDGFRYPKPYFSIDRDGLNLKNIPVPYLKNRMRSVEFIKSRIYKLRAILWTPPMHRRYAWLNVLEPRYRGSKDWQITFALLSYMNYLCQRNNIKFMIAVVPLEVQIADKNTRLPQYILAGFGEKIGIPVLDFLSIFEMHNDKQLYFSNELHWNSTGHRIAAEAIKDFLLTKDWLSEKDIF